jgi:hypothetical protein
VGPGISPDDVETRNPATILNGILSLGHFTPEPVPRLTEPCQQNMNSHLKCTSIIARVTVFEECRLLECDAL